MGQERRLHPRNLPPPRRRTFGGHRLPQLQRRDAQFGSAVRSPTGIKWQDGRNGAGASNGNASDPASQLVALQQQMAANMAQGRQPTAADVATLTALTNQVSGLTGGGGAGMGAGAGEQYAPTCRIRSVRQLHGRQPLGLQCPNGNAFALSAPGGLRDPRNADFGHQPQIPGQIVAQVSQNVFDTATGKYLLIPQGSRLVGAYDSNPVFGQSRALVAWQRIVFPDGKAIDLGAMPGSDSAGYAGFHDQVNAHWLRIFGSALLMSGVTAGVTLSQPQTTSINGTISASQALSQALGQQLGQATAMMIEKNLNISPTIIIRPGFRFNVVVVKDLTFSKPYRSFDY
jgi:type IV secretion system protein VirB10